MLYTTLSFFPTSHHWSPNDTQVSSLEYYVFSSNIISLPLAFVRSGYVNLIGGEAYNVGHGLYGWSRVTRSLANAYNLGVNPTNVGPSKYGSRYHGFPLRWLNQILISNFSKS